MKCPTDDTTLVMSERSGIEIDYCPQCRGVWLDRGELDKIIDRSSVVAPSTEPSRAPLGQPAYVEPQQRRDGHNNGTDQYGRKRKKEGWLSELFD